MELNIIVASGRDGAIGLDGALIWRIPADLRRFKALTMGHPVIMGRKTWESLPKRPLPGRRNIVVTRRADYEAPGAEVAASPEEAVALAGSEGAFVIGGAQLYDALFPSATRIYLTEIDAVCPEADARMPFPPARGEWEIEEASETEKTPDGVSYRYVTYKRR